MEIYMDLDETLWSVDRYLNPKTKQNLAKIAKCHTVVILSNGPLCEMDELKAYPLVLVSTLENRLYHQGNLEEFPLDGLFYTIFFILIKILSIPLTVSKTVNAMYFAIKNDSKLFTPDGVCDWFPILPILLAYGWPSANPFLKKLRKTFVIMVASS